MTRNEGLRVWAVQDCTGTVLSEVAWNKNYVKGLRRMLGKEITVLRVVVTGRKAQMLTTTVRWFRWTACSFLEQCLLPLHGQQERKRISSRSWVHSKLVVAHLFKKLFFMVPSSIALLKSSRPDPTSSRRNWLQTSKTGVSKPRSSTLYWAARGHMCKLCPYYKTYTAI